MSEDTPSIIYAEDDDYDPHEHRQVAKPTTNLETLIHIMKGALGTGILALPQAFGYSGWLGGLFCLSQVGGLITFCLMLLMKYQYVLCKRHRIPFLTFPQSMRLALMDGPPALRWLAEPSVWITDGFLIFYQLGICCVYIVFVAENIKQVVDAFVVELDIKIHIAMLILPFMLIFLIRNLKLLAPFSQLANIITFLGIGMLFYYICRDLPPLSERTTFASFTHQPLFFGTALFALHAVGVMISLENNMKYPKKFNAVMNIGMWTIVVVYSIVGFFGYWKYGEDSEGSVTLNIPNKEAFAITIKMLFTAAVFISYALQGYVPVEIIWLNYLKKKYPDLRHEIFYEYLLRLGVILITFFFAALIPRLGLFISLFGAFCISILGILFPALLELCVCYPDNYGRFYYKLIMDIVLIVTAIFNCGVGTYISVRDIVRSFQ